MINSEAFVKRLQKVIDFYGESSASFAEKIGVQRSSISHIISGRNKPSLEFILKILSHFPEVEFYWLINGKGKFPSQNKSNDIETESLVTDIKTKIVDRIKEEKEIDSIVIFYSDGSFKSFKN